MSNDLDADELACITNRNLLGITTIFINAAFHSFRHLTLYHTSGSTKMMFLSRCPHDESSKKKCNKKLHEERGDSHAAQERKDMVEKRVCMVRSVFD
jgi:hypothetical protein